MSVDTDDSLSHTWTVLEKRSSMFVSSKCSRTGSGSDMLGVLKVVAGELSISKTDSYSELAWPMVFVLS